MMRLELSSVSTQVWQSFGLDLGQYITSRMRAYDNWRELEWLVMRLMPVFDKPSFYSRRPQVQVSSLIHHTCCRKDAQED